MSFHPIYLLFPLQKFSGFAKSGDWVKGIMKEITYNILSLNLLLSKTSRGNPIPLLGCWPDSSPCPFSNLGYTSTFPVKVRT